MSIILTYSVPGHDLSQLHDALRRAAALLTPPDDANNTPEVVRESGDDVVLTFPDAVDEPAIAAIVAAHVPMARYDPTTRMREVAAVTAAQRRRALLRNTRAAVSGATDVAALRSAALRLIDAVEELV